jgi:hypothetical protein
MNGELNVTNLIPPVNRAAAFWMVTQGRVVVLAIRSVLGLPTSSKL